MLLNNTNNFGVLNVDRKEYQRMVSVKGVKVTEVCWPSKNKNCNHSTDGQAKKKIVKRAIVLDLV